jgi:hypothetical protein
VSGPAIAIIACSLLLSLVLAVWVYLLLKVHRSNQASSVPPPEPVEPEGDEPQPIDPDNPPRFVVYNPQGDREPPVCNCHQRPFRPGDSVLFWPIPGHPDGGVDLFCSETYGRFTR